MKRNRKPPENAPYRIASGSFFIAFFAYICGAFARRGSDGGAVLLVLGVVNLCLSLIYGRGRSGKRERRGAKRSKGGAYGVRNP